MIETDSITPHSVSFTRSRLETPSISGFERGCACADCNWHIIRLEEFNAQLARECDRLRRELAERSVA